MCLPTISVRKYKAKKLVTDLGWNAVEGSLLTDDAIRREVPPLTHYFDPMHVFFVQGQFSRHVGLLLQALKKMGWTPDRIAEACTDDSINHRNTRKVAKAQFARELGDAYFTEDGIWKVSASSQLGAAPLLHFLIRFIVFPTITCPDLKKELQTFLLLGSILSCGFRSSLLLTVRLCGSMLNLVKLCGIMRKHWRAASRVPSTLTLLLFTRSTA